jgi:hypothetical protein
MSQQRFEHRNYRQAFHHNYIFACFGNFQLGFALIPTKTDFMQITGQMLLAQIVKAPLFGPFKQCVKRRGRIVMGLTTRIFLTVMVNPMMRRILFADQLISMQFIGFKVRALIDKSLDQWRLMGKAVIGDPCRPHRAVTFNGLHS